MMQDFGKKKRYFLVFLMITTLVAIVFYIVKKILEQREAHLKRLQLEKEESHAEIAILEEQEVQKLNDETHEANMKVDLCHHNVYQKYSPDQLWLEHMIPDKPNNIIAVEQNTSAQVEVVLYYQTFVKLFILKIVSLTNLKCLKGNESNLVKLKVLLCQPNGSLRDVEVSQTYQITDDVQIDEKFSFQMLRKECGESILYLSLWSVDLFYRELLLGAISIDLSLYDHLVKTTVIEDFLPVRKDKNIYGYLLVSICHLPFVERLVCVIMSGKEFQEDIENTSLLNNRINPFVKVSLLNDGKLIRKYKTNVIQETRDPLFNEMIEFYIPTNQLQNADILFVVMNKDVDKSSKIIGRFMLGSHSNGSFYQQWSEAVQNAEHSIAKWYPLTR